MELKCHGCKSDTVFANCAGCQIRTCAADRGVERCLDCKDFPCGQFNVEKFKNVLDSLPHLSTIQNNIAAIISGGVGSWHEQQAKQWKCPGCQADFPWYADSCSKCGRDLRTLKGFKSEFDKRIFEYLILKYS